MTSKNNDKIIMSKRLAFVLILIVFLTIGTFETLWILEKKKLERSILGSAKLTKIQLAMTNSCIEYCNITTNKSLEIFKEYLYKNDFENLRKLE